MNDNREKIDNLNGILEHTPIEIRIAVTRFIFGIKIFFNGDQIKIDNWKQKINQEIKRCNFKQNTESEKELLEVINLLEHEFMELELRTKNYNFLLKLWISTLTSLILVALILGPFGLLDYFQKYWTFVGLVYGHLYCYIAFRYALFGVLIGNAVFITNNINRMQFIDLYGGKSIIERPLINLILGSVIAYIIARFIAEGLLSFDFMGFKVSRVLYDDASGSCLAGPHLRTGGVLFIIGLSASMASNIYLERLISKMQDTASSFLSNAKAQRRIE